MVKVSNDLDIARPGNAARWTFVVGQDGKTA